jgi:hypothetical protein
MRSVSDPHRRFSWPAAAGVVGVVAILAGLLAWRSLLRAPREVVTAARELFEDARSIAAAFRTGTVTTSFASYATDVRGQSYLQFATLKQVELFERKDEAALFWGQLALPDVIVFARAPVEYTYYLDLKEKWTFALEGQIVLVQAPPVRFNAPAVDVSTLTYGVEKGSVLRDEAAVLEKLRQGLTELAKERARQHIPLVRETGRRQTEELVETWLGARFSDGGALRARVRFADEAQPRAPAVPVER